MYAEIAIRTALDRLRHHLLYVLRNHTNKGLTAAIVDEPVKAKTVTEAANEHDVVLESDVRSSSTATPPTSAAAMTTAAGAMTSATDPTAATVSA
jgi:hypothetical protein